MLHSGCPCQALALGHPGGLKQHNPHPFCYKELRLIGEAAEGQPH